jgi:2-polyprenyl-3-methyl-5-hydroxy-6-metoxy-1,4-benzoquinol methylase
MNKKTADYLLSIVKNNYNEIADDFDKTREKNFHPLVLQIIKELNVRTGDKVLDLGCGNGRLVKNLSSDIFYLGLDNSSKLIELAKKKYQKENIIFKQQNILEIEKFNFLDFKYVFCLAVFHHLPGKKKQLYFLQQIYDKIDTGSILILSVWRLRNSFKFFKIFFLSFLKQLFQGHVLDYGDLLFYGFKKNSLRYYHAFSLREIKKIVYKIPFSKIEFKKDKYNYYFILKK